MTQRITAWSYSRWQTYDTCPQKAFFKVIQRLPEPENEAMKRGKKVHETLARFLRGYGADRSDIPGWNHFYQLLLDLRDLEPLVEQQWGFAKTWKPTDWFGNDTWFRSVLDATVLYDDFTADIVDFKTGKKRDDHKHQAELYAISLVKRYPQAREITVRFWYLDAGEEAVYHYTYGNIPALVEKWERKVEGMLTDVVFDPQPGTHCRWCHYAKSNRGPCKFG